MLMTKHTTTLLLTFILCLTATANGTKNWPGFRGNGDSHSSAQRLPLEWSETKNLAWQIALPGYGQSSPVIWRDRVYLTAIDGATKETLFVLCYDLKTGRQRWLKEFANTVAQVKIGNTVSQAAHVSSVASRFARHHSCENSVY
jgi:outer membrane protein assembly factor BamB